MCIKLCIDLTQTAPISSENGELFKEKDIFITSDAHRMKSLMNTSIDPCDNFYDYSCGNFPNVIKDKETTTIKRSTLFDLMFDIYDKMDDILQKPRNPSDEYYNELEVTKKFVDTCASAKLFPMEPKHEYLQVIKEIGGFPAIETNWDELSFDWFTMTAHLTRYGIVGFVDEKILPNHPFEPVYYLPELGFGFDVYQENIATNKSEAYIYNEKIMKKLLQVYGVSETKASRVIDDIFDLWREILKLKAKLPNKDLVGIKNKCQELSAVEDIEPRFKKWYKLFRIAWGKTDFRVSYAFNCPCNWFYSKLDLLAKKKPKAFANYMALKFLYEMHPRLISTKFQRRQCLAITKGALPTIFSHFYVKEHYNKENEGDIMKMITELKTAWKYSINTSDWFDDNAHNEASKKLENLRSRIGQMVDPISDMYIKKINSLKPTNNVALNILELAKFKVNMRHYGNLHPIETNKTLAYDILDGTSVRAFYMRLENMLGLMAGILQTPVYHKNYPNSIKYGTLGYIIGHEIGHGFEGYGFAVTSNRTQRLWLSKKSKAIVDQESKCFIDDYSNFKDPGFDQKLNGMKALSEIEADSFGLRQAFTAYKTVLKNGLKHEGDVFLEKETVPGLNFNHEKTFFLAFAQLYCAKYESRHYWNEWNENHPLNRYRVIGTLRNFDEFSNVYNCPVDSPMNPSQKCRLW
ncbi:membrane metallo-endopeptidase-like 1 [Episyrphus balteatus]|uniref:membrane metallo-endopeptidase-like 1 n=1 Tax=Episyrphus balteatus TaxID=286459 RepID=UPI0024864C38|nr:membrane metallo-endopeptidase-like 1 [Episyrphus balteatus]